MRSRLLLSACLHDRNESISIFRTIFDQSPLVWREHLDPRYKQDSIRILVDNKEVGLLFVTDRFFTFTPKLRNEDFVKLAEEVYEASDA